MKKKIRQFYYNYPEKKYSPTSITKAGLIDGSAFSGYLPIIQLGIQTVPGVKFCLNGAPEDDAIIVGSTGIYELDLGDDAIITGLRFTENSFDDILDINGDLIIDIVYEVEEEDE